MKTADAPRAGRRARDRGMRRRLRTRALRRVPASSRRRLAYVACTQHAKEFAAGKRRDAFERLRMGFGPSGFEWIAAGGEVVDALRAHAAKPRREVRLVAG